MIDNMWTRRVGFSIMSWHLSGSRVHRFQRFTAHPATSSVDAHHFQIGLRRVSLVGPRWDLDGFVSSLYPVDSLFSQATG